MMNSLSGTAWVRKEGFLFGKCLGAFSAFGLTGLLSISFAWANPLTIRAQNEPLVDVLGKVQEESGIRFKLSESLEGELITANVQASDWQNAIRQLLNGYNRVEVADQQGRLMEVFLLGTGTRVATTGKGTQLPEKVINQLPKVFTGSGNKEEVTLSRAQLLKLADGPFRSALSPQLYDRPEFKDFLSRQGITSLEDMKNPQKAMRVRMEARRQMKVLRKHPKNSP